MADKPDAPAARRNRNAILEVIGDEFRDCTTILEIGSGTGQHAIFFARQLPSLIWQTSDLVANHEGICAWLKDANLDNVRAPIVLDVEEPLQFTDRFEGVFSANTAHIMSIGAVAHMFRVVAECLAVGGKFCLYGPFNQDGAFSSDSNRNFDSSLRRQNAAMGIRDLEDLDGFAEKYGLQRTALYAMPTNNKLVTWLKK